MYFVPIGRFILSIIAVLMLAVSGWLGGQLLYHHHLGVAVVQTGASNMGAFDHYNVDQRTETVRRSPRPGA
jgi:hypothetical protein